LQPRFDIAPQICGLDALLDKLALGRAHPDDTVVRQPLAIGYCGLAC